MARNSEKAQSMLFRFREAQAADLGIFDAGRTRRPRAIAQQDSVPACEKWRGLVLKEISRKVSRIQEPALSDYEIRDLNDEINKLFREKHAWEVQIRNLGGPNYMRGGGKGYQYYGRAKDLPGVKEMFEAARERRDTKGAKEKGLEGRTDLRRRVDGAYYGLPDYEDEELLKYEAAKEDDAFEGLAGSGKRGVPPDGWEPLPGDAGDGREWLLPTCDEVQQELIERRRRKLLEQL